MEVEHTLESVIQEAKKNVVCREGGGGGLGEKKIEKNRRKIHSKMIKKYGKDVVALASFGDPEIKYLYRLYDRKVFGGQLKKKLESCSKKIRVQMTPGKEYAKAGGWCKTTVDGFVLSFPLSLYLSIFKVGGEKTEKIGGLLAKDRLGALQLTMEHELIHLLIQLTGSGKKGESHGELFRYLVLYYFSQTECKHQLGMGDPSKWSKLSDFKVDDYVQCDKEGGFQARVLEINQKTMLIMRLSDNSPRRVSPRLLKKISQPSPSINKTNTTSFSVGDYVKVKAAGKADSFYGVVRAKLIKYIVIQKKGSTTQYKVHPLTMEKITPEEYDDIISDVPSLSKNFAVGDYVKFTHKSIVLYGRVEKKMPKNIRISYWRDGVIHYLGGNHSLFTPVDRSEFLSNGNQ